MLTEEFIIEVFCLVEDCLKLILGEHKIRTRGPDTKLFDSEVITMELVGEFLGYHEDKAIWSYFKTHWLTWFPGLSTRETFIRQAAHLWAVKEKLQKYVAQKLGALEDEIHLFDGFPIPVCHFRRAGFSKIFRGEANYGYCATKHEHYYGFKGHLLISLTGVTTNFTVTQANVDERDVVPEISTRIHGLLIADKGLIRPELKEMLSEAGIDLQTPLRANMKDNRPRWCVRQLVSVRRLVETVIGQLTERFHIEQIKARNLWHLLRRITRKLLAHTIAFAIAKKLGLENPLQFEKLISI